VLTRSLRDDENNVLLLRGDEGVILADLIACPERTLPMRIAMLAPISWRTPPRHYGPWELVTSLLDRGAGRARRRRHAVRHQDSDHGGHAGRRSARRPIRKIPAIDAKVWEMLHVAHVFERAGEFDLIHNQADFVPLAFSRLVETPVVTTIHGFSSDRILPAFKRLSRIASTMSRSAMPIGIRICAMRRRSITASRSRISRSMPMAAKICSSSAASTPTRARPRRSPPPAGTGRRLVMAGIIQDQGYYDRTGRAALDGRAIVYLGPVGGERPHARAGLGRALLHLVNFDEPFGLSVVEALACGTPVIASRRGSMPELIEHGVTGFLVDSVR
jgi:hypothetical protein